MSIEDGGAAFPTVIARLENFPEGATLPFGMSLRDYFAIRAPKDVESTYAVASNKWNESWRYRFADAMLSARENK